MARVEGQDIVESRRGGCLDRFVQVLSLGALGIETTIRRTWLRPTNLLDLNDPLSTNRRALETGEVVIVQNYGPRVERKIVPNRKRASSS